MTVRIEAEALNRRVPVKLLPRARTVEFVGGPVSHAVPLVVVHACGRGIAKAARRLAKRLKRCGYSVRVERERPPKASPARPTPAVYRDRLGRELPLDGRGLPLCPRCGEWKNVVMQCGEPHCRFCRRSVRFAEPKRWLPDF